MKIRKAVFVAAGLGTRFLPATKAVPKEMLPIVDKPVIQYLVEEAAQAGLKDMIVITGPGKQAIKDHFGSSRTLETMLKQRGKHAELKQVRKISSMASFKYVQQPKPLGDGHAVLCATKAIGNEPCAVLFGDDLVNAKTPAIKQLMNVYKKVKAPVIALMKVPKSEVSRYGIVGVQKKSGQTFAITKFVEKPSPKNAPSNYAVVGKYIIIPSFLKILRSSERADAEHRLADGFRKWLKLGKPLYGCELQGTRYDAGDKLGFLMATYSFALRRRDLGPKLKSYLKKLT